MNGELRRAVYKKHMLFNKYKKCRTSLNWNNYRKQRNLVTKTKKQSMRVYSMNAVQEAQNQRTFGPPSSLSYPRRALMGGKK